MASAATPRKKGSKRKLLHEDSYEIIGYVVFVSSIKNRNNDKSSYFEIAVACESAEVRIVSFSIDDQPLFARNINKGYAFLELEKSNDSFKYGYYSSYLEKIPQFELMNFVQEPTSIANALDMPLYSRVCLNVRVMKICHQGVSLEGLHFKVLDVIDNSTEDERQLTLYGNLTSRVEVNHNYQINHLTLTRFSGSKVFKSSERTALTELGQNAIPPKQALTATISGVVKGVSMSSLETKFQCAHCNNFVDVDGSVAMCQKCDQMQATSSLIKIQLVQFTIEDSNNNTRNLLCSHAIIENFIDMTFDNKIQAVKKFINASLTATYEVETGNVVTMQPTEEDDMSIFGD